MGTFSRYCSILWFFSGVFQGNGNLFKFPISFLLFFKKKGFMPIPSQRICQLWVYLQLAGFNSLWLQERINYSVKGKILWENQIIAGLIDCGDVWFNRVWLPVAVITHDHRVLSFIVHYAAVSSLFVCDSTPLKFYGSLCRKAYCMQCNNKESKLWVLDVL